MGLIKFKNHVFNLDQIIDIKKDKEDNTWCIVVITTEKEIDGAGFFSIGYRNVRHTFHMKSELEADECLNNLIK